jgi:hypothetical protein
MFVQDVNSSKRGSGESSKSFWSSPCPDMSSEIIPQPRLGFEQDFLFSFGWLVMSLGRDLLVETRSRYRESWTEFVLLKWLDLDDLEKTADRFC